MMNTVNKHYTFRDVNQEQLPAGTYNQSMNILLVPSEPPTYDQNMNAIAAYADENVLDKLAEEADEKIKRLLSVLQHFSSQGKNVRIRGGIDPRGRTFYSLVFYDLDLQGWKEVKEDPVAKSSLADGLISALICYEKGWQKDRFKLHIYRLELIDWQDVERNVREMGEFLG